MSAAPAAARTPRVHCQPLRAGSFGEKALWMGNTTPWPPAARQGRAWGSPSPGSKHVPMCVLGQVGQASWQMTPRPGEMRVWGQGPGLPACSSGHRRPPSPSAGQATWADSVWDMMSTSSVKRMGAVEDLGKAGRWAGPHVPWPWGGTWDILHSLQCLKLTHTHIMSQPTQLTLTHWQAASCRPLLLLHHFGQHPTPAHAGPVSRCRAPGGTSALTGQ